MNPNIVASYALLGRLKNNGVTHAVISPGSRSTPLAYVANELFDTTVIIDERDSGFCAIGIAESTGRPVVVITTSGSAPTHLYPSIVEAYHSSFPLIVISADRPHELRGIGSAQTIDQVDMYNTSVRYSLDAICPHEDQDKNYWTDIADDLWAYSMGDIGVAGPVHLNMGMRGSLVPDGDESLETDGRFISHYVNVKEHVFNAEVLELISKSQRIIVTAGKNSGLTQETITRLNHLNIPVLADVISNFRNDNTINTYDFIARTQAYNEITPDLIIQCGDPLTSKYFNERVSDIAMMSLRYYDDSRDPYSNALHKLIIGTQNSILDELFNATQYETNNQDFYKQWTNLESQNIDTINQFFSSDKISEPSIYNYLSTQLQDVKNPLNILFASSMPIRFGEWLWKSSDEQRYFSHRGTNGIDGMLSSSYGIAHGSQTPTLCILGDVAFAHDIGFLPQCVNLSENQTVIFLVVDNNGGAIFSHLPQRQTPALKDSYEKIIQTPPQINIEQLTLASGATYFNGSIQQCSSRIVEIIDKRHSSAHVIHIQVEHESGTNTIQALRDIITG